MVYVFSKSSIFYIKLLSFYAGGSGDKQMEYLPMYILEYYATSSQRHRNVIELKQNHPKRYISTNQIWK
jgi:hypothetical protein